jgi:FlaA1/EpsC-like NDP-sugar epimerase
MENTVSAPTVSQRMLPAIYISWSFASSLVQREVIRRVRRYGLAVGLDIVAVTAAFEAAVLLRFVDTNSAAVQLRSLLGACFLAGVLYATTAYLLGLHHRLWRYASLKDGFALMRAVGIAAMLIGGLDLMGVAARPGSPLGPRSRALPLSVVFGGGLLSFLFLGCLKAWPKVVLARRSAQARKQSAGTTRVLIVGAGQAGAGLAARLALNSALGYRVMGFVDDNSANWHGRIRGIPILGPLDAIPHLADELAIDLIAIALPSALPMRIGEIIAICQQTSASIKILPGLNEVVGRQTHALYLREVNVADLLGREVVPLRSSEARDFVEAKTILVTGAAGSIGSELCRQLVSYGPAAVVALDNNETGLFELAESLRTHPEGARLNVHIGDITDVEGMARLFRTTRPQVVFHAAAYKHVPLLEHHPEQAVRINVLGTYHLCCLARQFDVATFVFVSSDKAADPVSVLGISKRSGEIVVQGLAGSGDGATRFCAVRFGNVIGSRGSVVPTFTQQIERGGPVTVTDREATRYFMTISEACRLVILTSTIADGGGLFLLDMGNPVRIADLAAKMIRLRGLRVERDVPIVYTGLRPGERLHEVLAGPDEQLQPTGHSKIHRVTHHGEMPTLAALEQRMQVLQESLARGDRAQLKERLFEVMSSKALV